ncbi:hypothetical protein OJ253_381 [Cryptosporidium canis]|uniref:Uncharacterized protein n=1 Tax=Cryptosporidium canis TaxID=195482 RepID=A0A9D5HVT9_9CRYT|nr:hypothetical protein OJ253_381 [Cryptosporidium canis]
MPSSRVWNDLVDDYIRVGDSNPRRRGGKRGKSSRLDTGEGEGQLVSVKGDFSQRTAMMSSNKEFTEDEFDAQEGVKGFNYFSIFKIPLMLFILSFTSVVFVEIFGRSYLRSRCISGQELKGQPNVTWQPEFSLQILGGGMRNKQNY